MSPPPDRRALAWLAAAHALNDMYQSAVPALLPFLVAERGLTYAAAGGLVLAASAVSSLLQPLLGAASDRRALPALMPVGILVAGAGIAAAALAPNYVLTAAAVLVSGVGVAAFHPEAARHANYASGARRATGMSVFSVGGNLGIAAGPALVTLLASAGGVRGVAWMALPAAFAALLLVRELPRLASFRPAVEAARGISPEPPRWGAFLTLSAIIVIRSMMSFGLTAFIPLWLVSARSVPRGRATLALTVMLLAGAAATLVGGRLADRFGRRRVLVGSLLPLAPLIFATLATPRPGGHRAPRAHGGVLDRELQRRGRHGPGIPPRTRRDRRGRHDGSRDRARRRRRTPPRTSRGSLGRRLGLRPDRGSAGRRRVARARPSRAPASQTGSPERSVR